MNIHQLLSYTLKKKKRRGRKIKDLATSLKQKWENTGNIADIALTWHGSLQQKKLKPN